MRRNLLLLAAPRSWAVVTGKAVNIAFDLMFDIAVIFRPKSTVDAGVLAIEAVGNVSL